MKQETNTKLGMSKSYTFSLNKLVALVFVFVLAGGVAGFYLQKVQSMKSDASGRSCEGLRSQLLADIDDMLYDISRGIYPDAEGMAGIRGQAAELSACEENLRVFQEWNNIAE